MSRYFCIIISAGFVTILSHLSFVCSVSTKLIIKTPWLMVWRHHKSWTSWLLVIHNYSTTAGGPQQPVIIHMPAYTTARSITKLLTGHIPYLLLIILLSSERRIVIRDKVRTIGWIGETELMETIVLKNDLYHFGEHMGHLRTKFSQAVNVPDGVDRMPMSIPIL